MGNSNVICYEDEIKIANNKLGNYMDFIDTEVIRFGRIIDGIRNAALVDDLIGARLVELHNRLKESYAKTAEIQQSITALAKDDVDRISDANSFIYPENWLDEIKTLLSVFF